MSKMPRIAAPTVVPAAGAYVSAVIFQPPLTPAPSLGFLPNVSMGERRTLGLTATYSFGP
jgi:hypothetical protein